MLGFWNLMDTPAEEQQKFMSISCNIAATASEITKPNSLSTDLLEEVSSHQLQLFLIFIKLFLLIDCLIFKRLKPRYVG